MYALCQGQVTIDNPEQPMVGVVHGGCQMEADIFTPFVSRRLHHARPGQESRQFSNGRRNRQADLRADGEFRSQRDAKQTEDMVRAIDAANIVVRIPEIDDERPGRFRVGHLWRRGLKSRSPKRAS